MLPGTWIVLICGTEAGMKTGTWYAICSKIWYDIDRLEAQAQPKETALNACLEFSKVVNAKQQVVAGMMYYITLEATNGGQKKAYEAKVWEKSWMKFKELQEFKPIGDAPSHPSA
ncbi:hypothetical protein HYC85_031147 [Camellia sinensis]|uniref:Cysteine proteinase inhibitor n=1 Tax=Camellia sinensis TaxID=4442 RepID=A0A7J7FTQ0_CAMSI|nr:hypothetical protein HYC85_031147 [Camellia sinensis]